MVVEAGKSFLSGSFSYKVTCELRSITNAPWAEISEKEEVEFKTGRGAKFFSVLKGFLIEIKLFFDKDRAAEEIKRKDKMDR